MTLHFWLVLVGALGLADRVGSEPTALDARVVWVNGDHVYLASRDSSAFASGQRLTFLSGRRPIASGQVIQVHDRTLAIAALTSGSLLGVGKPERLKVLSEPFPSRIARLRVGVPSRVRANPFFACGQVGVRSPVSDAYHLDALGERTLRLVRRPDVVAAPTWPETLLVRLFDDAADQEIALERGELDASVFWPGEPSRHLRETPRWQDALLPRWPGGVVAAIPLETGIGAGARAFAVLNLELFRGDLEMTGDPTAPAADSGATRYEVAASAPEREAIARIMNRESFLRAAAADARTVHLVYLEGPFDHPDARLRVAREYVRTGSFPREVRARADSLRISFPIALRCPIVCDSRLRPYVSALGEGGLIGILVCGRAESDP